MGTHSLSEAQSQLPDLVDRALRGETIVITRAGAAVVELKAVTPPSPDKPHATPTDIEWLRAHRITPSRPGESAGELVSRMRDEDDERLS